MNLTLQLSAELEAKLVEQAKALGKAPEELVLQVLKEQLDSHAPGHSGTIPGGVGR